MLFTYIVRMVAMALIIAIIDFVVDRIFYGERGSTMFKVSLYIIPAIIGIQSAWGIMSAEDIKKEGVSKIGTQEILTGVEIDIMEEGKIGIEIGESYFVVTKNKEEELSEMYPERYSSGLLELYKGDTEIRVDDEKEGIMDIVKEIKVEEGKEKEVEKYIIYLSEM